MYSRNRRCEQFAQKKLPRIKRTLALYGEREDTHKYFHCWNCGFVCDVQRDRLDSGSYSSGGNIATSYTDTDAVTKYKSEVIGGCPFCGTKNWR